MITITVNGQSVSFDASASQIAALQSTFEAQGIKPNPNDDAVIPDADATAYVQRVVQSVCPPGTASETVLATLERALCSYASEPIPQTLTTEMKIKAIKAECQRRIIALTGAPDLMACIIKQSNANMRANELNDIRIGGGTLTAEQEAEATALRNLATAIKAIRSKSDALEISLPNDFTNDSHWN